MTYGKKKWKKWIAQKYTVPDLYILIGSLSNRDDNSSENVT